MINKILKPNGKLVGLLFPIDKNINDGGPPFAVDLDSTISIFSKYLLIIFMITRPILTGSFPLKHSGESALHAILLDDSFSMQGNSSVIEMAAASILKQIPDKSQLIWINFNKGVMYKGLKEDIQSIDHFLQFTYNSGALTDGLYTLLHNSDGKFTSKEVYLLTDC